MSLDYLRASYDAVSASVWSSPVWHAIDASPVWQSVKQSVQSNPYYIYTILPILFVAYLFYYICYHVRRPHLMYTPTKLNKAVVNAFSRLHRPYFPTWFATHEIVQAAIGSFVRFDPRIKRDKHFEREILEMRDGERLALDWLNGPDFNSETPIIFTCHGLAGHTDELNMQYLALGLRDAGFRFAIFNRRGCALDMKLTKDFLYLWGCTSDMREMLAHIKKRYPSAPIFGVGYSAGSNLLTKYLGETGEDSLIDAGISVANAYDVAQCSAFLAKKPFHSFVMVNILKNMLARNEDTFRKLEKRLEEEEQEAKQHHLPAPGIGESVHTPGGSVPRRMGISTTGAKLDLARVKKVKSVLEWDEHFSMLMHTQYSNLEEFYADQTTTPEMVSNISVPLLNLSALDDPIIPDVLVPYKHLSQNSNIILATTARGGHLGFTEGFFPFNKMTWLERLTVEYFEILSQPDNLKLVKEVRQKAREKKKALEAVQKVKEKNASKKQSGAADEADASHENIFLNHNRLYSSTKVGKTATPSLLPVVVPRSSPIHFTDLNSTPLASPEGEDFIPDTPEPRLYIPRAAAVSVAAASASKQNTPTKRTRSSSRSRAVKPPAVNDAVAMEEDAEDVGEQKEEAPLKKRNTNSMTTKRSSTASTTAMEFEFTPTSFTQDTRATSRPRTRSSSRTRESLLPPPISIAVDAPSAATSAAAKRRKTTEGKVSALVEVEEEEPSSPAAEKKDTKSVAKQTPSKRKQL